MTNTQKSKGDRAEREVKVLICDLTGYPADRMRGAGRADDWGDIDGVPDTTIQVKAYANITRSVNECLARLDEQQARRGSTFAAGFVRRPGGRYVVVMTPEMWATYSREAIAIPAGRRHHP